MPLESPVHVRPFEAGDREQVVRLWRLVFPDDPPWNEPEAMIERKLAVQPYLFFVALSGEEVGERVIGTVLAGFDGVRGWVHHLVVHPAQRRRKVGARLMRSAELGLAGLGCPKLNLQVRSSNAQVVAFYESLGYAVEDRISPGKRLAEGQGGSI